MDSPVQGNARVSHDSKFDAVAPVSQFHYVVSYTLDRHPVFLCLESGWMFRGLENRERLTHIRVVCFCILRDQIHLLLEVPPCPQCRPDEATLFAAFQRLPGRGEALVEGLQRQLSALRACGHDAQAERLLERTFRRMYDLGHFMKSIKQELAQWYNRMNKRRGVLWESKYHSVQTGGTPLELLSIAAALDLLPFHAGEMALRETGIWSGFAAANAGCPNFGEKLRFLMERCLGLQPGVISIQEALERYRFWIFGMAPEPSAGRLTPSWALPWASPPPMGAATMGVPADLGNEPPWIQLAAIMATDRLSANRLVGQVSKLLSEIRDRETVCAEAVGHWTGKLDGGWID